MKVKELIEKLKLEDEDAEVILSADEEGNYYSPLEGRLEFGKGYYIPNNAWSGEFLYQNGIEKFDYKSSNGKVITKVWEYVPDEVEDWRTDWGRTKSEKQRGMPEKYTYDDWQLGHYIKEKNNKN